MNDRAAALEAVKKAGKVIVSINPSDGVESGTKLIAA